MLERHPKMDLLVIALGTNDSRDISAQCVPKAVAHLNAMIELARGKFGSGLSILLVGPPNLRKDALGPSKPIAAQREAKLKELGAAFSALAQEKKCGFFSFYGLVPDASLHADGVHPDATGNEPLAAAILPKLLPSHE
jgi:acyl-CoA thioesterase I